MSTIEFLSRDVEVRWIDPEPSAAYYIFHGDFTVKREHRESSPPVVYALGERPIFKPGDQIRVGTRSPIGHYRVPTYLRGKIGVVQEVIDPIAVDNEEEGFGRNAGDRLHYYRIAIPLTEIWADYHGSQRDRLYIEIFETWVERI